MTEQSRKIMAEMQKKLKRDAVLDEANTALLRDGALWHIAALG